MSNSKLKDRIDAYKDILDFKMLSKVPVIISVNGKSFSKITSLIEKPYCQKFSESMFSTMLRLCSDIEGVVFAYQHSDEIMLVSRNDQTNETLPWYDNKIQKITSLVSSIATIHFNKCASTLDLNFMADPIFTTQIFTVPTITEAINTIIYKQQHNFHTSIQFATFYELLQKYSKHSIKDMLAGLSVDEKIELLKDECNIDFNDYPMSYRRGAACYKVPKVINNSVKNKWTIDEELPIFAADQVFLSTIFKAGQDIFRN